MLTLNKLLTRFSQLLAQIKAGNNSYKMKNESDKYYINCISIIKSSRGLQQHNQVILIMEEKMIVISDPKTFWIYYKKQ